MRLVPEQIIVGGQDAILEEAGAEVLVREDINNKGRKEGDSPLPFLIFLNDSVKDFMKNTNK